MIYSTGAKTALPSGSIGRNGKDKPHWIKRTLSLDAYMGCDGYYMKPKIEEDGKSSFFIAKDNAKSSDVGASFELVKEAIGIKEEKEVQVFTGKPRVECAVCADVPNLTDVDFKNE